jgi:murein DD-endopeptidase MepM/ murein hydrolase activator NlpD
VNGGVLTQGLHGYNGIDIGAPSGTGILASAAGTVIIANRSGGWNGGYGNYIVIQHDNGTQTLYAHASRIYATAGQRVAQGALIGAVGRTGKATGPHLHFEVRGATNPFGAGF